MLSQFQFETASLLGLSGTLMVAAQSVGAAAGNMVAIHNVVAASATVGLLGKRGDVLRITIIPTLYYITLAGIITFFFGTIKSNDTFKVLNIYNEKTYSGPMGMGLLNPINWKARQFVSTIRLMGRRKLRLIEFLSAQSKSKKLKMNKLKNIL